MQASNHYQVWQMEHETRLQAAQRHREHMALVKQIAPAKTSLGARVGRWLIERGKGLQAAGQRLANASAPEATVRRLA